MDQSPSTLSVSQSNALKFITGHHENVLVYGAAGVGKSYLMSHYVEMLNTSGKSVIVSCPTNKAKGVMNTFLHDRVGDNLTVNTITSLLSLSKSFNDSGGVEFTKKWKGTRPPSLNDFPRDVYIIIDEASMISKRQSEILLEIPNVILFTGDKYQLFPINEFSSHIFASNLPSFEITKMMRTDNKVLLRIFNSLRIQVARASKYEVDYIETFAEVYNSTKIQDREAFYICGGPKKFRTKIISAIESKLPYIILCYTRRQAANYNNLAREIEFGKNIDKYVNGERLVFDSFFDEGGSPCYTSDEIEVARVHIELKHSEYFGKSFKVYALLVCNEEEGDTTYYKIHEDDKSKFYSAVNAKRSTLLMPGRRRSKKDKDAMWNEFNSNKRILDTPLVYNYAMTVHKSQGSTYDNVFLDVEDCDMNAHTDSETFTRLVYTGATRASKSLTIHMSHNYFS